MFRTAMKKSSLTILLILLILILNRPDSRGGQGVPDAPKTGPVRGDTLASMPDEQKCVSCHIGDESLPPNKSHKKEDIEALVKAEDCQECHFTYHKKSLPASKNDPSALNPPKYPKIDSSKYTKDSPPSGMIYIPDGDFIMGHDNRLPDEKPRHTSRTDSYFIDQYETTNAEYLDFAVKTGRRLPDNLSGGKIPFGKENHPVTFVTWFDGRDYCAYRGKRLPVEREWEKAARGTDGRLFPWGDEFHADYGNVPHLGIKNTTPVGSFPKGKSAFGLFDMSGNVWEWVDSAYLPHPGNTAKNDNFGEKFKILKGGSWVDCHFYRCGISAPSFNRSFFVPQTKNKGFGFRCAMDAPKSKNTSASGLKIK